MKLNADKYTISGEWAFKLDQDQCPYLENQRKGKIIIDPVVKQVLESFASGTLAEVDEKKPVSREMLELIIKVFSRVGVLTRENEPNPGIAGDENKIFCHGLTRTNTDNFHTALPYQPLVSVVIIDRNDDGHLPGLLESVRHQNYPNLEIIIVGPRSGNRLTPQSENQDPGMRILELKPRTRFKNALDKGIKNSRGDYILVLDHHMVLAEDAVNEMVKAALSHEKWSAIAPKIKDFHNPAFIYSLGKSFYPYIGMGENCIGWVDFGQFDGKTPDMSDPSNPSNPSDPSDTEIVSANFSAVLLNREAIKTVGPVDTFYTSGGDNRENRGYAGLDWCFRAGVQGYPVISVPGAVVYRKPGETTGNDLRTHKFYSPVENRLYFAAKNLGRKSLCRFLKNFVYEDLKNVLIYLKRKDFTRCFGYMGGYIRLMAAVPALMNRRFKIQRRRTSEDAAILAKAVPFNTAPAVQEDPRLDIHALRTYYAGLLDPDRQPRPTDGSYSDIVLRQERRQTHDKKRGEKCRYDYSFFIKEAGEYDIYLLGFITRDVKVYLDNRRIPQKTKKDYRIDIIYPAAGNIFLSAGRHVIELARENHVKEIIISKSASGGQEPL